MLRVNGYYDSIADQTFFFLTFIIMQIGKNHYYYYYFFLLIVVGWGFEDLLQNISHQQFIEIICAPNESKTEIVLNYSDSGLPTRFI